MSAKQKTAREVWAVNLSPVEASVNAATADALGVSRSDALREGLRLWREAHGSAAKSVDRWVNGLLETHGPFAALALVLDEYFHPEAFVVSNFYAPGAEMKPVKVFTEAIHDRAGVQLWAGDADSDARCFLGRVPPVPGAGITIPVEYLPQMRASDVNAV